MDNVDWEKKDRRMAWMNINSACSNIVSARINAGLFKPKTTEEAMKELMAAITIEFNGFLELGSKGEDVTVAPHEAEHPKLLSGDWKYFCHCGKGVSEKVKNYSEDNFGEVLCFDCQKKAREKIENATGPKDVM